jgi:hypothetical protein
MSTRQLRLILAATAVNAFAITALCYAISSLRHERDDLQVEVGRAKDFCHLVRVELGMLRHDLLSGDEHRVDDARQRFFVAGPGHTSRDEIVMCSGIEIPWDDYNECWGKHDAPCLAQIAERAERAIVIPEGH